MSPVNPRAHFPDQRWWDCVSELNNLLFEVPRKFIVSRKPLNLFDFVNRVGSQVIALGRLLSDKESGLVVIRTYERLATYSRVDNLTVNR